MCGKYLITMFSIFNTKQDNAVEVLSAFLKALNVRVTATTISEELPNHPDYPSLLAISDILNVWNIENAAISIEAAQLKEIPTPFLTSLKTENGIFILVNAVKDETIEWWHSDRGLQIETLDEFSKKWENIVLLAEPSETSGEANYQANRQAEIMASLRLPLILTGFSILILSAIWQASTLSISALIFLKIVGCILSLLLIAIQYGKPNYFTASLCKLNSKTDCNDILNSPASKIFSWLSWSEVGLFYFVGGFLVLLTPIPQPLSPHWERGELLGILSVLALPYTFYSFYYQWRIAKSWCPLCLAVLAVLWLEAVVGFSSLQNFSFSNTKHYLLLIYCFGLTPLLWFAIKPFIIKAREADGLQKELKRFTNNPDLFEILLYQQRRMTLISFDLQPIVLGNPAAEHTITMVTNPFCGSCAKADEDLETLLAINPNIKAEIIFAATNQEQDQRGKVARHILSLENKNAGIALHDWYNQLKQDYDSWAKKYPLNDTSNDSSKQLEIHFQWCISTGIDTTPTFFIDGFEKPQVYDLHGIGRLFNYISLNSDLIKST